MEKNDLFSKIAGCLYGIRIGDALGRFAEMMTPERILEVTNGKGITGFQFIKRDDTPWLKHLTEEDVGGVTDDTNLTDLIAESIISCKNFDIWDIALRHVRALEQNQDGWGKTTVNGVEELREYFDTRGRLGRKPGEWPAIKANSGCGNGVAMKIASLAIFSALRYDHIGNASLFNAGSYNIYGKDSLYSQVRSVGSLTHPDKRATSSAFALAYLLEKQFIKPLNSLEKLFNLDPPFVELMDGYEKNFLGFNSEDGIAPYIGRLIFPGALERAENLRAVTGTSCLALQSVPFSIGVFLRKKDDLCAGVLEAVNAGGDTDTNASMVGALIGSEVGIEGIPKEWREYRPEYKKAEQLAEGLIKTVENMNPLRRYL